MTDGDSRPAPRRVLLKLSGEALMGPLQFGIHPPTLAVIAQAIQDAMAPGDLQLAVVLGGGNIFRGLKGAAEGMDRATADSMGMLATTMNGMAMQDALERAGVSTRLMTAIEMRALAEPFIRRRAVRHLDKGRVVIFSAGTGHPYFTTDSGAALRAAEVHAQVVLKGTKVDGVYDKDPQRYADAVRFERLTFDEVVERRLGVMDLTAVTLCRDNALPIVVFDMTVPSNITAALRGEALGTRITP